MTLPVNNDGTWNMYQDIVEQSEELEKDIRKLHSIRARAEDLFDEMYDKYCDLPDWELLHAQISMSRLDPEVLLGVLPLDQGERPQ